jgi:hypothetical protein
MSYRQDNGNCGHGRPENSRLQARLYYVLKGVEVRSGEIDE